jgi:hypothetical protein
MKTNSMPGPASDIPAQTGEMKNEADCPDIDGQNKAARDDTNTAKTHDFANAEYTKWWIHRIKLA